MLKYLTIGSIKFLTGSRAKAEYTYAEENLFSLYRRSPPGKPLHLSDFKSIEVIAAGPLNLVMLAKCTFKDGEEATARVWYSIFEVIYIYKERDGSILCTTIGDIPQKLCHSRIFSYPYASVYHA